MKYFHKLSLLKNITSIEMFVFFAYLEYLKSDSHLPKKNILFASVIKMMKNYFYLILKALLLLKIFKFLSLFFVNIGKMT